MTSETPQPAFDPAVLTEFDQRVVKAEEVYAELKYSSGCKYIRGLTIIKDPRIHKYWQFFSGVVDLCEHLDTPVRTFLRCTLWRTVDDLNNGFEIHPTMLLSPWALERWRAFKDSLPPEETPESFVLDVLGTMRISRNFLRARMRGTFGGNNFPMIDLFNYHRKGHAQPEALRWIESGAVARPYLAVSGTFWVWAQQIASDLRDEYLHLDEIRKLRMQLLVNPEFVSQIMEIVGSDFMALTEGEL